MKCRACGSSDSHVLRTTWTADAVVRSRQCDSCGNRWQTAEIDRGEHEASASIIARFRELANACGLSEVRGDETDRQFNEWRWFREHAKEVLLQPSEIRAEKIPLPLNLQDSALIGSVVYFLLFGEEIVYVGVSVNGVTRRLLSHMGGGKVFDSIAIVRCPEQLLKPVESIYINWLRPELNSRCDSVESGYGEYLKKVIDGSLWSDSK